MFAQQLCYYILHLLAWSCFLVKMCLLALIRVPMILIAALGICLNCLRWSNPPFDWRDWWIYDAIDDASDSMFMAMGSTQQSFEVRSMVLRVSMQEPAPYVRATRTMNFSGIAQTGSRFFTRLPRDIRYEIYKLCLLVDGTGVGFEAIRRREFQHFKPSLHAVPFAFGATPPEVCTNCPDLWHRRGCSALNHAKLPKRYRGRGRLVMLKSCKLAYVEMIPLLYSQCFSPSA